MGEEMISVREGFISPGEVVISSSWALAVNDEQLLTSIRRMVELSEHPYLTETHCGGGPNFESVEEFLEAYEASVVASKSLQRKRHLTAERRKEFASARPALELALIDRDGYVCSEPGCNVSHELTIDHILPVSRGGTDELQNLRFLCRSHNSAKGDR
ncbi:HNH endonuclease [Algiphilus sp. NNCM1]|uniref:HNH endonuclease n=1 Tax=Algiphilus sp. TaxID=1872431 RepID=UPI001CA75441|nr:HNH endonuclease signature motif containing protein [Algiphilus sp.]MBY8967079.1 HNH endonuclease [Algiphilus acroporae]MCI5062623.1 HNH endonuclease [Algiphilus sp.]MCI5102259.1 HNH endonuclease [Algiphilus sp.]